MIMSIISVRIYQKFVVETFIILTVILRQICDFAFSQHPCFSMSVHVCICMYIYVCACVYIHVYMHVHVHVYMYVHVYLLLALSIRVARRTIAKYLACISIDKP